MTTYKKSPRERMLDKLMTVRACGEGQAWAANYNSASQAWQACTRPEWMFWLLRTTRDITHVQAIKIGLAMATRACRVYRDEGGTCERWKPVLAAVKAWVKMPCTPTEEFVKKAAERYRADTRAGYDQLSFVSDLPKAILSTSDDRIDWIYNVTLAAPNTGCLTKTTTHELERARGARVIRRVVGNPYRNI